MRASVPDSHRGGARPLCSMPPCRKCGFDSATHLEEMQTNTIAGRAALRSRLSELDALIGSLTAERQRRQDVADTIIYPVLSLPVETTAEIFRHCIPAQSNLGKSSTEAPWVLAQICRQWRQIALNTPYLWQSFLFRDGEASMELLHLWLSRSGGLPLKLNLTSIDPFGVESLIETSLLHCHRWQDVKFRLPNGSFSGLDLRDVSLPLLQSISLRGDLWSRKPIVDTFTIADAPSLRHVDLSTLPSTKLDIPWARMTTLTLLQNIPLRECMPLLKKCRNLVNLTVSTTGPAATHTDLVTLTSLETLTCNLGGASVLQNLTLPHLVRLVVTSFSDEAYVPGFSAFINRSTCPLQFLTVQDTTRSSLSALAAFLRAVPNSTSDVELTWYQSRFQHLFSVLQYMDVLPGLKHLRLRAELQMNKEEYDKLLEVLRARVEAEPPRIPLESITLKVTIRQQFNLRMMPDSSWITQLRELVSDGLQVDFAIESFDSSTHVVLNSRAQD
ncbi:F-box domain-containing protein [Mycena sanguinolenta]|uniref:F-box domain-containing protein n=1 Tax=Mycena sanguinolenta TaxID=230812 RepID=A0A8H6ZH99_9AGAR|nr:F-box domain-containing protein [Mycena sanguinolenta]